MREFRTSGSVEGAVGNHRPYSPQRICWEGRWRARAMENRGLVSDGSPRHLTDPPRIDRSLTLTMRGPTAQITSSDSDDPYRSREM